MKTEAIISGIISPHAVKASMADRYFFCVVLTDGRNHLALKIPPVLIQYPLGKGWTARHF
jgi:hypothetical protein